MEKGIPTIGPRGIQFRSRLEAKYALLFEFLNLQYDYESLDLANYIPDFVLYFKKNRNLLVEVKGLIIDKFREAAEKLIHSGYDSDCIFFGSQSPKWNSERRLVEFYTSKYVKPISAEELPNDMRYSKSSWNYINGIEIYYEKKKDRLWKVYEDVGIAYCESCLDFAFFVENFCICCQKQNVQVYRSETRMIENEWIKFCNQTQWKKSDKEPEILFAPKRAKKEGEYYPKITRPTLQNHKHVDIKQSNMKKFYHATDKNELVYSLFNQMKENGEAYFCENGINWEECCSLLDELNSFYITCKEGFCCDMNYIIVESCDLSKLNQ